VLRPLSDQALRFQLAIKFSAKASDGPMCGSRDVVLLITIPGETQAMRVRSK
jgi:hypothetical protein